MGTITRPHGIRGDVCVDWYADDPSLVSCPLQLELASGQVLNVDVAQSRPHKEYMLLRFKGLESRNDAERLRNATLWLDKQYLPDLDDGEAYLDDLLEQEVYLEDGTVLGVLDHIEMPAGQMLWAIQSTQWEYLFPANPEFIIALEPTIIIAPPEGLLETCKSPLKTKA